MTAGGNTVQMFKRSKVQLFQKPTHGVQIVPFGKSHGSTGLTMTLRVPNGSGPEFIEGKPFNRFAPFTTLSE
jgi:hypothetical protein